MTAAELLGADVVDDIQEALAQLAFANPDPDGWAAWRAREREQMFEVQAELSVPQHLVW